MPAVEQRYALSDKLGAVIAPSKLPEREDGEMLLLLVGPDDVSLKQSFAIAPRMNNIEAQQFAHASPRQLSDQFLVGVFGMLDCAVFARSVVVSIGKTLVDAWNFSPTPTFGPLSASEPMSQEYKYPQRTFSARAPRV